MVGLFGISRVGPRKMFVSEKQHWVPPLLKVAERVNARPCIRRYGDGEGDVYAGCAAVPMWPKQKCPMLCAMAKERRVPIWPRSIRMTGTSPSHTCSHTTLGSSNVTSSMRIPGHGLHVHGQTPIPMLRNELFGRTWKLNGHACIIYQVSRKWRKWRDSQQYCRD